MNTKSLLTFILVLSSVMAGNAQDEAVSNAPKNMLGLWAVGGKCDDPASTLTIDANSVQFGSDAPQEVYFSDDAAPKGDYGALIFKAKGAIGNVEYQDDRDLIVSHPKGFGKGTATTYSRCIGNPPGK